MLLSESVKIFWPTDAIARSTAFLSTIKETPGLSSHIAPHANNEATVKGLVHGRMVVLLPVLQLRPGGIFYLGLSSSPDRVVSSPTSSFEEGESFLFLSRPTVKVGNRTKPVEPEDLLAWLLEHGLYWPCWCAYGGTSGFFPCRVETRGVEKKCYMAFCHFSSPKCGFECESGLLFCEPLLTNREK